MSKKRTLKNTAIAQRLVAERGGKLISKSVHLVKDPIEIECSNNHRFSSTLDRLKNKGNWCKRCSSGLYERICRAYFEEIFSLPFPSTRKLEWLVSEGGNKLELDGFNNELSLAFEHQGEQHFSEKTHWKMSKFDELKSELCKKNGVKLVVIPELTTRLPLQDVPNFLYEKLCNLGYDLDLEEIRRISITKAYTFSEYDFLRERGEKQDFTLVSDNALISRDPYDWICNVCRTTLTRTIYQIEENGCQICSGRDEIGPVDGLLEYSSVREVSDKFNLNYQSAARLWREGYLGQGIVDKLRGDDRQHSPFPISELSFNWGGSWYVNKKEALAELQVAPKRLESFCLRRGLGFREGLELLLRERSEAKVWRIFGREFSSKRLVYEYTKVSETRVNKYLKDNDNVCFEQAIEQIALQYDGIFFHNLKELAAHADVKYQTLIQRMSRNQTDVLTEIEYLKNKNCQ